MDTTTYIISLQDPQTQKFITVHALPINKSSDVTAAHQMLKRYRESDPNRVYRMSIHETGDVVSALLPRSLAAE